MMLYYVLLITVKKRNTRITKAEEGIIISVNSLSNESNDSNISYIRNPENNANATIAYFSFLRPLFRYAEIDNTVKIVENTEPTAYSDTSITSLTNICKISCTVKYNISFSRTYMIIKNHRV